jgi:hypothetical protein
VNAVVKKVDLRNGEEVIPRDNKPDLARSIAPCNERKLEEQHENLGFSFHGKERR